MVVKSNKFSPLLTLSGTGDDSQEIGLSFSAQLQARVSVLEYYSVINFEKNARLDQ